MTPPQPTFQRGDVVSVLFPFTDVSQTKKRPALILSNATINQTGDYLLVQITSQVRADGFSLPLTVADFTDKPLPLTSFVRVHKIFLLNESLIMSKITSVRPAFCQSVVNQLMALLR
jgi:mRNA interferase MazF